LLIITNDRKSLLNFVMDVISWGKQKGKHLFKCKNCGIYFTSENNLLD